MNIVLDLILCFNELYEYMILPEFAEQDIKLLEETSLK